METSTGFWQPNIRQIPQWLYVSVWAITIGSFVYAAWLILQGGTFDLQGALLRFVAPLVLLALTVFISVFESLLGVARDADIETWLFLGAAAAAGVFFAIAMMSSDQRIQERFYSASLSIGSFSVGLKVGGRIESRTSVRSSKNTRRER